MALGAGKSMPPEIPSPQLAAHRPMHPTRRSIRLVAALVLAVLTSTGADDHQDVARSSYHHDTKIDAVVKHLRSRISGRVFARGTPSYEDHRAVHNGACHSIYPAVIAVPVTTYDVAEIVKTAIHYEMELSYRSGGHSFICQGIKPDALHIDMRSLDKVQIVNPYVAKIGPGARFGRVLKLIDPDKYTLIHGQVSTVGVGGFLQGIGVNPMGTSDRYGYGSDHVIEYTMVLADGSIAKVKSHNTTILQPPSYQPEGEHGRIIEHNYMNDLHFAMRASGASFGIMTEILYKMYPQPETLSCLLYIFITNDYDFQMLDRAAQDGRYAIAIFEPMFYRRPKLSHLMAWFLIKFPQLMKMQANSKVEPVFVSVVDLHSRTKKTEAGPAIAFIKSFGLRVANDNPAMLARFGLDQVNLGVEDQEAVYMTRQERLAEGYHSLVSANLNGFNTAKPFASTFLHHPVFGMFHRKTPRSQGTHCDFCLWLIHFSRRGFHDNIVFGQDIGPISVEFTCTFNPKDPAKVKNCPRMVKHVKQTFKTKAVQFHERPHQYPNTPTCDDGDTDFGVRYWGNNYERLLKIKQYWDPNNVFNYCHSVGSTRNDCCPF